MTIHFPKHPLDLVGRSDQDPESDQTAGVQFAIQTPDGDRYVYGDQSWVAHGVAISDGSHPTGRVVWRTISISYGEWEGDPTDDLLARARTYLARCGSYDVAPTDLIGCLVAEIERLRGGGS